MSKPEQPAGEEDAEHVLCGLLVRLGLEDPDPVRRITDFDRDPERIVGLFQELSARARRRVAWWADLSSERGQLTYPELQSVSHFLRELSEQVWGRFVLDQIDGLPASVLPDIVEQLKVMQVKVDQEAKDSIPGGTRPKDRSGTELDSLVDAERPFAQPAEAARVIAEEFSKEIRETLYRRDGLLAKRYRDVLKALDKPQSKRKVLAEKLECSEGYVAHTVGFLHKHAYLIQMDADGHWTRTTRGDAVLEEDGLLEAELRRRRTR